MISQGHTHSDITSQVDKACHVKRGRVTNTYVMAPQRKRDIGRQILCQF